MSLRERASGLTDRVWSAVAGDRTNRLIERLGRVRDGDPWFDKRGLDTVRRRPVDDGSIERRRGYQRYLGVAFAGLLGAALGLGLKDLLADVVGGLVVVLEQPFQVGDKVQMGEHYGEVVDIGVRSTTLVTPTDTLVVVPNFTLFNDSVANANTSDAEMLVVVEFYVDPDADVERATDIVEDALVTSPYVFVSDATPASVVVEDDLYYRTIRGKAYVNDLRSEVRFKTDVTERVLDAFDDAGIESPKVSADLPAE